MELEDFRKHLRALTLSVENQDVLRFDLAFIPEHISYLRQKIQEVGRS